MRLVSLQEAVDIDGKVRKLSEFAGKVTIVVNVASACGFTDENYKGAQGAALYTYIAAVLPGACISRLLCITVHVRGVTRLAACSLVQYCELTSSETHTTRDPCRPDGGVQEIPLAWPRDPGLPLQPGACVYGLVTLPCIQAVRPYCVVH